MSDEVHTPLPPFAAWSGPRNPRIVIIGEAWGEHEAECRQPFVGASGKELFELLGEAMPDEHPELHAAACREFKYGYAWLKARRAWLEAAGIAFTNVLAFRPRNNSVEALCASKAEVGGAAYGHPAISYGKYLRPEFLPEVDRLGTELRAAKPNLIIPAGNVACWATLGATNIGQIRGTITSGRAGGPAEGLKALPTYHPAAVLRQWSYRPIVLADLMKAAREADFPEIRRPERFVCINPTLSEVAEGLARVEAEAAFGRGIIAVDIETKARQITCISFAGSPEFALVVPFFDPGLRAGASPGSYWGSAIEELEAWRLCKTTLESPLTILGQNFLYDLQYISKLGIRPRNCTEDTMLLHHSMFPELQKGLGFLGSVYTNEASWKLMRTAKTDTVKRDE